MDTAYLVLEFLKVLTWPVLIIAGAMWFRNDIRHIIDRVLKAPEIELEYRGLKLKLNALEKIAQEVANESTAERSPKKPTTQELQSKMKILESVTMLDPKDIELMVNVLQFKGHEYYYISHGESSRAYKLSQAGFLRTGNHSDGIWVALTPVGRSVATAAVSNGP
jgi:hypothetical protein